MQEIPALKENKKILKPIVVITGADTITGLITARSLRGLDVEIWGVVSNMDAPACKSRYWNRHYAIGELAYLEKIIEIGKEILEDSANKAVLLASQDEVVISISRNISAIEKYFKIIYPDKKYLELMMDKTKFHQWAQKNDYLVPGSHIVKDYKEIDGVRGEYSRPYILKPLVRGAKWDNKYPNKKFFHINSSDDLNEAVDDAELFDYSEKYLMQEWIPGDDASIYFCLFFFDESGKEVAYLLARKIYQWPLFGGSTAVCTEHKNPDLLKLSRKIMTSANAKGLCSIEFKQHENTGEYYITEPTVGRNDLQSYIGTAAGANLSRCYVEYLLGLPLSKAQPTRKAIWLDEISVLRIIKSKKTTGSFVKICKLLIFRKRSYAYFDFRDLYPLWYLIRSLMAKNS